jgi:hypothetical protein
LSREPTEGELATLRQLFARAQSKSKKELAAMTAVASVLFNLDAALTR